MRLGNSMGATPIISKTRNQGPTNTISRRKLSAKQRNGWWTLIVGVCVTPIILVRRSQLPLQMDEFSMAVSSQLDSSQLPSPFHLIQKTRGLNWKAWHVNSDDILHQDKGFPECRWGLYTSQHNPTKSMNACLHPTADLISDTILIRGYWDDCHAVSRQWYAAAAAENNATSTNKNHIHIEIGANIGSCIFELLLSAPDAHIVAFEPQARNLFRLTSTLKAAPSHLSNRVVIMPIALGAAGGGVQLEAGENTESGKPNYGGNFISTVGNNDAKDSATEDVAMERLGDIFAGPTMVRLMKIDAQGYECNILDGMPQDLVVPQRIVTEVEEQSLERNGCSREGLLDRLVNHSYVPHRYRGGSGALVSIPTEGDCTIVAVRQSP